MAFAQPPRVHEYLDWLFLLSAKQTAYGTALVGNTLIDRVRGVQGFAPVDIQRGLQTDLRLTGREFSTGRIQTSADLRLARTFEMSSELAGFFLSFACGSSTPTGEGDAKTHTIRYLAPATEGIAVPVFTAYEQLWGEEALQRLLPDLAVASVTLSGRKQELCRIVASLVGSGRYTPGAVSPPATDLVERKLHGGNVTVEYGARAGGADITDRILEWEVIVSPALDEANGYMPNSGIYRGRIWQGATRQVSANLVLFADLENTDVHDDWVGDNVCELKITITGAVIGAGPAVHSVELLLPAFQASSAVIGEQDGKLVYRLSIAPENIIVDGDSTPDEPFQAIVINETAKYLQAPGA